MDCAAADARASARNTGPRPQLGMLTYIGGPPLPPCGSAGLASMPALRLTAACRPGMADRTQIRPRPAASSPDVPSNWALRGKRTVIGILLRRGSRSQGPRRNSGRPSGSRNGPVRLAIGRPIAGIVCYGVSTWLKHMFGAMTMRFELPFGVSTGEYGGAGRGADPHRRVCRSATYGRTAGASSKANAGARFNQLKGVRYRRRLRRRRSR